MIGALVGHNKQNFALLHIYEKNKLTLFGTSQTELNSDLKCMFTPACYYSMMVLNSEEKVILQIITATSYKLQLYVYNFRLIFKVLRFEIVFCIMLPTMYYTLLL